VIWIGCTVQPSSGVDGPWWPLAALERSQDDVLDTGGEPGPGQDDVAPVRRLGDPGVADPLQAAQPVSVAGQLEEPSALT
jgi:hypothetical protein